MMDFFSNLYLRIRQKVKIHHVYICTAFIWGLVMVFMVPPFQVPDEESHFRKALAVGNAQLVCDDGMLEIPEEAVYFSETINPNAIIFHENVTFDVELVRDYEYDDGGKDKPVEVESPLCAISPISHLVPAVPAAAGALTGANQLLIFYLMRIANLTVGVLLISLSISLLPYGKRIAFLLGLLPMTIFLLASVNYDALFIPILFVFIASVLHLMEREKAIGLKEILILIFLTIVISTTKLAFVPMILISLILRPKLFKGGWKGFLLFGLVLLLSNCAAIILFQNLGGALTSPEWTDPSVQIQDIVSDPLGYLVIFARTVLRNGVWYARSMIGTLGWLDYRLTTLTYVLMSVAGFLFGMVEGKKVKMLQWQKVALILLSLATVVIIMTGMYIFSTHPGVEMIEGVQGRYFIPIAFAVLLPAVSYIPHSWTLFAERRLFTYGMFVVIVISAVDTVWQTIIRYYG